MMNQEQNRLKKGQKTAKQILEAATRCIGKIGIEKTSVTNIAKEAGLKRSIIAYHFPKKSEIFPQIIQNIIEELSISREDALKQLSGRARLEMLLKTYFEFFYENFPYFNSFMLFIYMASIETRFKEMNDNVARIGTEQISICLRQLLSEKNISGNEKNISNFSEMLFQQLLGSIIRYYTTSKFNDKDEYKRQFTDRLEKELDLFLHHVQNTKN